jgi:multimeric flavodoxin WrbA
MNILILNGGPSNGRGAVHTRIRKAIENESASRGWNVTAFDLAGLDIKPCRGCFACWLKHPGICAIRDDQERVLRAMAASDVEVWTTPVTFGGYSSELKKALDRFIPNLLPFFVRVHGEVHHPHRYERARKLLVLGTLPAPDPDSEKVFRMVIERNALNLHATNTQVAVLPEDADEPGIKRSIKGLFDKAEVC